MHKVNKESTLDNLNTHFAYFQNFRNPAISQLVTENEIYEFIKCPNSKKIVGDQI